MKLENHTIEEIKSKPYLSTGEFAKISGLHPLTVSRYCRQGKLIGVKRFGRRYLIPASLLEEKKPKEQEAQ